MGGIIPQKEGEAAYGRYRWKGTLFCSSRGAPFKSVYEGRGVVTDPFLAAGICEA